MHTLIYMKHFRLIVVLAALGILAGCSTAAEGPTYTVHGTVTIDYADIGDAVVMITAGSNSYSVSIPIDGNSSFVYSVSGVPAGTYSVSLSYPSTYWIDSGEYWLDGSAVSIPLTVPAVSGTVTATADNITVGADLQLDAYIWYGDV
jgi:hypothetical protein